jgi:hypothetical protein
MTFNENIKQFDMILIKIEIMNKKLDSILNKIDKNDDSK